MHEYEFKMFVRLRKICKVFANCTDEPKWNFQKSKIFAFKKVKICKNPVVMLIYPSYVI